MLISRARVAVEPHYTRAKPAVNLKSFYGRFIPFDSRRTPRIYRPNTGGTAGREDTLALTPQQQLIRRTGVSASEIAAIAGFSRYGSPISVYDSKVLGIDEDDESSIPMELGVALEEPIAALWRRKRGMHTAAVATLRHPKLRFAICTPDRGGFYGQPPAGEVTDQGPTPLLSLEQVAAADALVQCKSASLRTRESREEWGEPETDVIPDEYIFQETWEMGVTGHREAQVAVLFDKDRFAVYRIPFRPSLFDGLYAMAEEFMAQHVLAKVPPQPDATDHYRKFLRRAHPGPTTDVLEDLPQELREDVIRFAIMRHAVKLAKTAVQLYGDRIRLAIGDGVGFTGDFGKITWKKNRDSTSVDWQAAANRARLIAMRLLNGDPDEKEREQLAADLRSLEVDYPKVRVGARVLRPSWAESFEADLSGETTVDFSAALQDMNSAGAKLGEGEPEEEEPVGGEQ